MEEMLILDFPDPESAEADGLIGVGGVLNTANLLRAYSMGIFPWTSKPVSWWSPDPRGIIEIGGLHINRSLRRFLKKNPYEITFNKDFEGVIRGCAQGRDEGTWIDEDIIRAYLGFHLSGFAKSVECWADGKLVGGLYGVAFKGLFAGESMFSRADNASKVALTFLMDRLVERGYQLMDIQMLTPVTASLGGVAIPRSEYLRRLEMAMECECQFDS